MVGREAGFGAGVSVNSTGVGVVDVHIASERTGGLLPVWFGIRRAAVNELRVGSLAIDSEIEESGDDTPSAATPPIAPPPAPPGPAPVPEAPSPEVPGEAPTVAAPAVAAPAVEVPTESPAPVPDRRTGGRRGSPMLLRRSMTLICSNGTTFFD